MQHSQTDVIYPSSPFVYDYRRINETFNAASQELDRQGFLLEVASVGVDYCDADNDSNSEEKSEDKSEENTELYRLREMLGYLSEITIDQLNSETGAEYSEIRYFRTDQVIDSSDPKYRLDRDGRLTKQLWINLHTLAYECTKNSSIIDSDMKEVVSWCIVPIIGNVRPMSADSIIYSDLLEQDIKAREEKARLLEQNPHLKEAKNQIQKEQQAIVDCSVGEEMVNNRMQRFAQRNFIKREVEKKDDSNAVDIIAPNNFNGSNKFGAQIVRPNKQQITFNSHTRANAQNIRSAIMSKYKQVRLRQVPQQKDAHRSIDLRIRNASEKVADTHNYDVMSRVRFMDRTYSDYRLDDVIITKVGSIWKFTPMTSGRIILDLAVPEYEIPSGKSRYLENPNAKKREAKKITEKSRHDQLTPDFEPDYVGNAKKVPKPNTKISRIAKRENLPKQEIQEVQEFERPKPFWMSRKVMTKEEEEAAKEVVGDKVGDRFKSEKKTTRVKKPDPQDKITSSSRKRRIRDNVNGSDKKKREIDIAKIPDLAFVTVVRLDTVLCLTLNCLKIINLIE